LHRHRNIKESGLTGSENDPGPLFQLFFLCNQKAWKEEDGTMLFHKMDDPDPVLLFLSHGQIRQTGLSGR
jgi:hypothetical protein